MGHILRLDEAVEFLAGDEAELERGLAQADAFVMRSLGDFGGIIVDPGSFSGSGSLPRPQRGPEASQRISFAIFMSESASVFSAPEANTISSCAESAANLFGCERNGRPVSSAILRAARSANSGCALSPVPTAVPPMARS